jgi:hypothetical protein
VKNPTAKEKQVNDRGKSKQNQSFGSSELLTVSSSEGGGTLARFELARFELFKAVASSRAPCTFCNCGDLRKEVG